MAEFASKLGLARTTWSNYEAGRRLPSHEIMQLLERIEGVTPDQILPSPDMTRVVAPSEFSNWWSFIPVLWVFSRLQNNDRFQTEGEELRWWAERIQSLAEEFEERSFNIAEEQDLDFADAALQVCEWLKQKTDEELWAFVAPEA